jgi:hypothetical protein
MLSSDSLGPDIEPLLLLSVFERRNDRAVFLLGRVTILALARLTLALRIAETKWKDDPEEDAR